jgi:predicted enzyme related to lactoylglutathione lyase
MDADGKVESEAGRASLSLTSSAATGRITGCGYFGYLLRRKRCHKEIALNKNHGKFVWYDLMTTDMPAAESFYKSVIGWDAKDSGMSDRRYTILSVGADMVGGMMPLPDGARDSGTPSCWSGYIGVDDVDVYAERVKAAGGTVHRKPEDIPGIGRFAVVADPHGAVFLLFTGKGDQPTKEPGLGKPGQIGWHELHAGDLKGDFDFYSSLFGWARDQALDMGDMGTYQLFKTGGGTAVGGMMTRMSDAPGPFWLYYVTVKGIEAAGERVSKAGGKILHGPHQVPGDAWILKCVDPQGAMFAMVGSR